MSHRLHSALYVALVATLWLGAAALSLQESTLASTLECHRRMYAYKVTKTDSTGRICWDVINVMSCWGRCDSNEVSLDEVFRRDGREVDISVLPHVTNDRTLRRNDWHSWKLFEGYHVLSCHR